MRNVLVTGGAGYVGSHACKALALAGYRPVVYDDLACGHAASVRWGPLEQGDIRDEPRLATVFDEYRPLAVLHFAAFAYVGESITNPEKYYSNNVEGTLSLLRVMREKHTHYIIFSSTCATYGIPNVVPIPEDTLQVPISPYGASKLMVERILADYGSAYGLKSVALRYFNAAGCDPDGELGETHEPETHLIPLVLDTALKLRPHVTIFGNDYDTPDGTCIRDYVHVSDIAEAHVLALKHLLNGVVRPSYNLGTGTGASVAEVINTAYQVTGRDIPVVNGPRRPGDPPILLADARRAREDFNWIPKFPAIRDMVETAWRWRLIAHASREPRSALS
jgi:UDP-arabinose 4-epimerase